MRGDAPIPAEPDATPTPPDPSALTDAALVAYLERRPSRVLVVGDIILDRYTWGDAERISPEAPVIVLRSDHCEHRLGGAGSVAAMVHSLGGGVSLLGLVGDDPEGSLVLRLLEEVGIAADAVVREPGRPTTLKERLMGRAQYRHAHQILRVDRESRTPPGPAAAVELSRRLRELVSAHEIILVADYGKGVCQPALLAELIALARAASKRVLVDPARGCDPRQYRGAACLTPNRPEAAEASGVRIEHPDDAIEAARVLAGRLDLEAMVVTLDRDGMALYQRAGGAGHYPTRPRQVYDITGAGDMVLSVLGLSLAAGASYDQAVRLANLAGGLEVEKVGVVPVTWDEIAGELAPASRRSGASKIVGLPDLLVRLEARRRQGERIVMTNGCFDLLHPGHVWGLEDAAAHGDCLVVALNSDASVRRLKGPGRPIIDEHGRAAMLAALESVDYVTLFDHDTPLELVRAVGPDVLIKGGTYSAHEIVGREVVESYGGSVLIGRLFSGWSTTDLARRIQRS